MEQIVEAYDDGVFCQGDIIKVHAANEFESLGFILTADCDIYNKKFGDKITYLPIITLYEYINRIWAKDKEEYSIDVLVDKILSDVNKKIKTIDERAAALSKRDLLADGNKEDVEKFRTSILKIFDINHAVFKHIADLSRLLNEVTSLRRYHSYLSSLHGDKSTRIFKRDVLEAISQRRLEYFYLNFMPRDKNIGWIILLRDIQALDVAQIFKNLSDGDYDINLNVRWAHRVGRLPDGIRFAVAQSFAGLFSRIGLPTEFEEDRAIAFDSVADEITESLSNGQPA